MNKAFNSIKLSKVNMYLKATKRISMLLLIISLGFLFTGCNRQAEMETNLEYSYSFTDSLGNRVQLENTPERVVSLVGSYAETWMLAGGSLVGVTNDVITERAIDVPSETKIVGTIKEPNIEEVLALSPDFVILTTDVESHKKAADILEQSKIPYAFFKVEHFEDYLHMLDICTDITGNKDLYEKNGLAVKKQIDKIVSKIYEKDYPEVEILFIRAFSSGAKAKHDDNMACKIFNDLGTVNIAAKHESLLEQLSMEEIIEEDPDYIFVVTMGDSQKAIQALKDGIEKNPAWSDLSAVKNDRYIVLPKDLFHYKPNARWGESYEYIAKILYPEEFR
ncbi:MAG: ABC transporter substrate-binding protein [Clostridiales bacterium]|nr:ABC transporter substrate-binding protein [Clostridiales bacterium]